MNHHKVQLNANIFSLAWSFLCINQHTHTHFDSDGYNNGERLKGPSSFVFCQDSFIAFHSEREREEGGKAHTKD